MSPTAKLCSPTPGQVELVRWCAGLGAVTADALAAREDATLPSARARLANAERQRLMRAWRLLRGCSALYTVTRAGVRAAGTQGLQPSRVSAGGAAHAIACCGAAVALERRYPEYALLGEPAIRRLERERRSALVETGRRAGAGEGTRHRPDLLLLDRREPDALPVAIEIEISIKAPQRLAGICLAWARCRNVAGVIYLASPEVIGPLRRAVADAEASSRVSVLGLDAIDRG